MADFKAKMHQIVCRLGLRPRPRWGSLQRSPRPPNWILGGLLLREGRGGKRKEGDGKGGEGRERRGFSRYTPNRYILDKGLPRRDKNKLQLILLQERAVWVL